MKKVICSDCLGIFELTTEYWHRNKYRKTGFSNICKKCKCERNKLKYAATRKKKLNEYALYKGEQLLHIGTVKELAKVTKLKEGTIRYYKSKVYADRGNGSANRKVLISLEG